MSISPLTFNAPDLAEWPQPELSGIPTLNFEFCFNHFICDKNFLTVIWRYVPLSAVIWR
ncbi:hypothetical protein Cflav_PD5467 [Pedosphaera parvula Ellin514]|uniref:Uncharacterized protein n=1 Tax=Pedosphaera parvula (strain Ellin514) TaxID=320771 RepID=B9XBE7_PEDPL|nr:hypothetical protein Cflav_PD5467 [Pedosphaera parvula Ellin514]